MPCYAIDGVIPVVDPAALVHPAAVLIGDVVVGPGCYLDRAGRWPSASSVPPRCASSARQIACELC